MRGGSSYTLALPFLVFLFVLLLFFLFPALLTGRDEDEPAATAVTAHSIWPPAEIPLSLSQPLVAAPEPPRLPRNLERLSHDWFLELRAEHPPELMAYDGQATVAPDIDYMRTGVKRFIAKPREFEYLGFDCVLERALVEGALFQAAGAARYGGWLEATGATYIDMAGLNHRTDLRVSIINVPWVKKIRLVSRTWARGWARPWVFEPYLERGGKFSVSDLSLTDGRLLSHSELQIPPYLGSRGLNAAIVLSPSDGFSIRFDLDLPDLLFDGVPWKLKLPSFNTMLRF
jgi:hypothetical protein